MKGKKRPLAGHERLSHSTIGDPEMRLHYWIGDLGHIIALSQIPSGRSAVVLEQTFVKRTSEHSDL